MKTYEEIVKKLEQAKKEKENNKEKCVEIPQYWCELITLIQTLEWVLNLENKEGAK